MFTKNRYVLTVFYPTLGAKTYTWPQETVASSLVVKTLMDHADDRFVLTSLNQWGMVDDVLLSTVR